jgi:hypothetical protein
VLIKSVVDIVPFGDRFIAFSAGIIKSASDILGIYGPLF